MVNYFEDKWNFVLLYYFINILKNLILSFYHNKLRIKNIKSAKEHSVMYSTWLLENNKPSCTNCFKNNRKFQLNGEVLNEYNNVQEWLEKLQSLMLLQWGLIPINKDVICSLYKHM